MQKLKEKILSEGQVLSDKILKVDSFLNHQVDPDFAMELGNELADRFSADKVTKVLTVEASGIAVALTTGLALKVPVVFAKKKKAATQEPGSYCSNIFSFTKQESVDIYVNSKFISKNDRILIVDDFLAQGEALRGMIEITEQAGATLVGVGIVIEKVFQGGGKALRKMGIRIESLAPVQSLAGGKVQFL
ncbi:xanthine phosphoribosyltransferase [Desulfotomaculum arcticum]|uniref:Xanthine phosphoribosyltransferase n=1 Tax=Desulfotruncus arcticus DSM 17038 TaxID=1121424 RepID=A0A1I2NBB0_9FIRM|nr:xanthine phosphoribosyltransferase [Desulfotruncus arcticus]SFG01032.1 xanthine phosphoribosyltransferase [Desulfotomaculum arcticum] [Desulfotruncus arcticus DSM 17038]